MPVPPPSNDAMSEIERLRARVDELESERETTTQLLYGDPERNTHPLLEQIPAVVWVMDRDLRLTWWTGGGIRSLAVEPKDLIGVDIYSYLGTRDPESVPIAAHLAALEGRAVDYEQEIDGVHFAVHVDAHRDAEGSITGVIGVSLDITPRVHAERDRIQLISELREALEQVKTLSGLLPICMHCKSIRNDGGFWEQVENYVRQHSDAEFSHSICPACMREALAKVEARPAARSVPGSRKESA